MPGKKPGPPPAKARPAPLPEPDASDDDNDSSLPDEYDGDDDDGSASDDEPGEDSDDDQPKGQHARPGFRPKDRDGVQWDYVTHEGVGFNDGDDEDAMTFEENGKAYFKPDWGDWKIGDFVGYWTKHFDLEGSQEGGEKNFEATLNKARPAQPQPLEARDSDVPDALREGPRVHQRGARHPAGTRAREAARRGEARNAGPRRRRLAEPVSFERWVEIQTAQGVWAQQGKDVNAMLKKVFGLTAVDWSNMSASWSQKLSTDFQLAGTYGELNAKYAAHYSAGDEDPDGDLEV